ncbi:alpha-L-arabinofuranosidase C-terminal domain-containing protein [Ferruginibacter paludis]|uniref:alpha-L-arabinofuranosidase C-terminal domain-containing protein n=1 Tax=Ferruginibacter paludis TaxID=1310417 RepID=UPI0025B4719E|nr:alpha-L-arabinofuranosidase C-terminal domain-containing protein [Ferruginibacter paludis]MDN3655173.1 alpha-L-arabinofuranosidase C-terminal domain-containing protein [Ferruginibacter paludis]
MKKSMLKTGMICVFCAINFHSAIAQTPTLNLDFTKPGANVSPMLYGLMTEEINHAYDGGLYAELIRNRIFKDNKTTPEAWSLVRNDSASVAAIKLMATNEEHIPYDERRHAINGALSTCLRLTVEKAAGRVGIANEGYWGIPVKPSTTYNASLYIKGTGRTEPFRWPWEPKPSTLSLPDIADNAAGPITVSIESNDGKTVYASGTINLAKSIFWKKYEVTLTTKADAKPTADARFVITTDRVGEYYFNLVSLFPPTYHNKPNGFRPELIKMMADMKPKFLRFPGGNYLEGPMITDAFPWKTTLGPLEQRPGHKGSWGYRASDGLGLLEFLQWCEDIGAEPLLAVYAGYSLQGDHVDAGPLLQPYVEDALDEIEYVTGDVNTYWGAKRAADGHPAPFKLKYIEVGNEDWFDRTNSYDGRFKQFRAAIEKKYPSLHVISTIAETQYPDLKITGDKKPEVVDEHYYRNSWEMWENASQYDKYDRNGPKIFVGEWATREGAPTTNLNAALGDAAWMTGMERNADLIIMSCYAPLFVNVNKATSTAPKAWQWDSDLIGYDALNSYGSPSYYVQKLFGNLLGDKVVSITATNIPTQPKPLTKQDSTEGKKVAIQVPTVFYSATADEKTGDLFIKIVNTTGKKQPVNFNLNGVTKVLPDATMYVITSARPQDTNTITEPEKIVPVSSKIKGVSSKFKRILEPYSVSVLQLQVAK